VGAGPVAEEKIESLLRADADVVVVAPKATAQIEALAATQKIRLARRRFRPADLRGVFLVVAATSSPAVHAKIFQLARRRAVLCNVVDDPPHCNFYYGSVVRRGMLQIAISTEGRSPALAQRIRKNLEKQFGPEYQGWIEEIGKIRERLFAKKLTAARRRELLHRLAGELSFEEFQRRGRRR